MQSRQSLVTFVSNQQNVIKDMNPALSEQFKVVNRPLGLGDAYNLAGRPVDYELIFDSVAFLLAGI